MARPKKRPRSTLIYPLLRRSAKEWIAELLTRPAPEPQPEPEPPPDLPCVYFIRAESGLCKIGKAKDVAKRLRELQTGSPVRLEIARIIECDEPWKLERCLHRRFAAKRRHGEWFALTGEDMADCLR